MHIKEMKYFCFTILFLLLMDKTHAQQGSSPIRNFPPQEYNGATGIGLLHQSKRGLLYLGGDNGCLHEYDGSSWKRIPISCQLPSHVIEDNQGNIFVSDYYESCISRLSPNSKTGDWEVASIPIDLPDSLHNRVMIMPHLLNDEVYCSIISFELNLRGFPLFYKYNGTKFASLPITTSDAQQTYLTSRGLLVIGTDKCMLYDLKTSEKQELPFSGKEIGEFPRALQISDNQLLMWSYTNLFIYHLDKKTLLPFGKQELRDALRMAMLHHAINLKDGNLLIATIKEGLIIVNKDGQILKKISTQQGLINNAIIITIQDKHDQIWVGHINGGVDKIDIVAPVDIWNHENGVSGIVTKLTNYQGVYFASAMDQVIYYDTGERKWKPLKNSDIDNTTIQKVKLSDGKEHLLIGQYKGFSEVVKNRQGQWEISHQTLSKQAIMASGILSHSKKPDKIYLWNNQGRVGYVNYHDSEHKFHVLQCLSDLKLKDITHIHHDIWAITKEKNRAVRIALPDEKVTVFPYDSVRICVLDDQVQFIKKHTDSVFTLNAKDELVYSQKWSTILRPYTDKDFAFKEGKFGTIWITKPREYFTHVLRKNKAGKYQRDPILERVFAPYMITSFYEDSSQDHVLWLNTAEGIVRLDVSKLETSNQNEVDFNVYVRQVKIGEDSVVFHGNFAKGYKDKDTIKYKIVAHQPKNDELFLDHYYHKISFQVSAPFLVEEKQTQYAYLLEGVDTKWSAWTNLHVKEYANLSSGKYVFKVKAKNYLGYESAVTTFRFEIQTPWYRTVWAYLLYAMGLLLLAVSFVTLYTRSLRKKNERLELKVRQRTEEIESAYVELQQQNEEISQQRDLLGKKNEQIIRFNNDIVSSINYAERIQRALLPFEDRIHSIIGDYFMFFRPRDIVSGDFYWIEEFNNQAIVAIADCTGHGVPGAFMSMLGSSGLKEAVFQQCLIKPNLILEHLHDYILMALKQEQSQNNDGMDIALMVLDKPNKVAYYSGAMNPFYYVQDHQIKRIKADKVPIGGKYHAKEYQYTLHKIILDVPTSIYMSSDGFQDQFGGKANRKFMTKRFRELLLEISSLPITDQEKKLAYVFEDWKGFEKQIDDVLVFGVEI